MGEVARRAGVSVGGFYARFRGKSALLHLADMDFLDACQTAFDRAVPDGSGGSVEDIFRKFITVMVDQFAVHRQALLQAMRHAEADDLAGFRERAAAFNAHVHGRIRRLMAEHRDQIGHDDPATAVNLAIFIASAAARDAVLRGSLAAYPVDLDRAGLVDHLVRSATRYLTGGGQ